MIDFETALKRHSVRSYTTQPVGDDIRHELNTLIDRYNAEAHLDIKAVYDEPDAFGKSRLASYGKFSNANNYICMAAAPAPDPRIALGYYGERLVLELQSRGLCSCWVGLTFSKKNLGVTLSTGSKLYAVICFGYGADNGRQHKRKKPTDICADYDSMPEWFKRGVDCALLAPTAINQQKFRFALMPDGQTVDETTAMGFYTKIDMGIARYHFEVGAEPHTVKWASPLIQDS